MQTDPELGIYVNFVGNIEVICSGGFIQNILDGFFFQLKYIQITFSKRNLYYYEFHLITELI